MQSLGIDIGYSAVKVGVLDSGGAVVHCEYVLHRGNVADTLAAMLERVRSLPGAENIEFAAATGSGSAFASRAKALQTVNEVAAIVEAGLHLDDACASIIEMGGQTAKFLTGFTPQDKASVEVSMTSNCSSGTGSFLQEQVSRLGMDIEDYSVQAANATFVPRIAGRCSVFAKTDITHHQQEGVAVADILAGLARAVVKNYRSAVMRRLPRNKPMLFVGGVSRNSAITKAMASELKLEAGELIVSEHSDIAGAVGAAILAARGRLAVDLGHVSDRLAKAPADHMHLNEQLHLSPLAGFGGGDGQHKHVTHLPPETGIVDCWLGIDVGSTSTNLVLADAQDRVLGYRYLRTAGDPVRAVRTGLEGLRRELGSRVRVAGAATTGSGRYMIGRLVGADVVRDEITAQARAAVTIDPTVDTIFEIGGQDSKFIALEGGVVADFQMNKICAAGTGSFIEEQAKKLGVELNDIGPAALAATRPASLGERCTVFMESSIAAHMARGAETNDLAAGLCYSIIKNYMNRVVGQKRVGNNIFLMGGVAHNQGVVNAFRAVTGKEVTVPPFFSVTGALGAAILAREALQTEGRTETGFKGFALFEAGLSKSDAAAPVDSPSEFNRKAQDFIFEGYDGTLDPARKTVGIPRALFTFGMFPMFHPFFKVLGFNVLLSEPTSEETIRLAQDYSLDETCYPVKLINGHVAELVEKGVDYLFFPDLYTVDHPGSLSRQNFGCAYMQLAFKIVNKAMDLDSKGITLLAPTIAFNQGKEFMQRTFMKLGRTLGRTERETGKAMQAAMMALKEFETKIEERAKRALSGLDPNKKTFVLISKIYGVADPALNLGIPDKLASMGYQTLPFYDMPEVDIFKEHPNIYWPFAQHILEAAKLVSKHPNLYAVFLTHHGCGPDTVTAHYFKEIMGDKPYLTVEVDEHSSAVGVVTRIEAFVNSLRKRPVLEAGPLETYTDIEPAPPVPIQTEPSLPKEGSLVVPRLYPYSRLACSVLKAKGIEAFETDATTAASIDMGRNHTVTNEYYSMAVLLGDLLNTLNHVSSNGAKPRLLLPQNEGAEVDGQFSRFVRTKLDEIGLGDVALLSPFLEDLLKGDGTVARVVFLCLVAGDLVLRAPRKNRRELLAEAERLIANGPLTPQVLKSFAKKVRSMQQDGGKTVFAIGEPLTLYNDVLNDHTFQAIEDQGHRVVYAPLSECMWSFWRDFAPATNGNRAGKDLLLDEFKDVLRTISSTLGSHSHFENDLEQLMEQADKGLGFYAGSFGRYRSAKPAGNLAGAGGVITVSPMYENTGISLDILQKRRSGDTGTPMLGLTFDGTRNKSDETKVESFLFYL